ncbi:hypothetical protein EYF80_014781 [Liparis tanakae]|uniref:Uncharacterized protein n=1 Tax=Liparis tanakae TaxID=230148 RepID=A0A4Z2IC51_9TELE|nr:hypothetical protein EYF80_014781 [Liparis tanakae]
MAVTAEGLIERYTDKPHVAVSSELTSPKKKDEERTMDLWYIQFSERSHLLVHRGHGAAGPRGDEAPGAAPLREGVRGAAKGRPPRQLGPQLHRLPGHAVDLHRDGLLTLCLSCTVRMTLRARAVTEGKQAVHVASSAASHTSGSMKALSDTPDEKHTHGNQSCSRGRRHIIGSTWGKIIKN